MTLYYDGFSNYSSVDSNPDATPEVRKLVSSGFVMEFKTIQAVKKYLDARPAVSKLAMVTNEA